MTGIEGTAKRPRVRPTGFGGAFFVAALAVFLIAVHYSSNLAFALCFWMIALLALGYFAAWRNMAGESFAVTSGRPVFVGQGAVFGIEARDVAGLSVHHVETDAGPVEAVDGTPGHGSAATFEVAASARGMLRLLAVVGASRYPMGLFEARVRISFGAQHPECLVYPQPHGAQPLPQPEDMAGRRLQRDPDDFDGVRDYAAGDPLNRIHWKASARTSRLVTRIYDGAAGIDRLMLDWRSVSGLGAEPAVSQLCQWVLEVSRQGREFGLRLAGNEIGPAAGDGHRDRCLRALALHKA